MFCTIFNFQTRSSYSLHGASFINGFARVASTKEKAIGAAVGAVGGLVSGMKQS